MAISYLREGRLEVNVISIILTFIFSVLHIVIPFIKAQRKWLLISISSFFIQSFYYLDSHFIYSFSNTVGAYALFNIASLRFSGEFFTFSSVMIGKPGDFYLPFQAWGLNIVAILLGIYLFYVLLRYFIEKPVYET